MQGSGCRVQGLEFLCSALSHRGVVVGPDGPFRDRGSGREVQGRDQKRAPVVHVPVQGRDWFTCTSAEGRDRFMFLYMRTWHVYEHSPGT